MLGALIGDYVGSPYEFDRNNIKTEEFPFFGDRCRFTDDSVLTIAVAEALMDAIEDEEDLQEECVASLQKWSRAHPDAGYGGRFSRWIWEKDPQPYNSWGNGSAMRVSAVGWLFDTLERTEKAAELVSAVTHNHEEGIRGAQATAVAIFLARTGSSKEQIKQTIESRYGYDLDQTLDEIRPTFRHVESCQETLPVAIRAFLESRGFEDAIRKAVSVGGDSDTIACITGSIAEAHYTVPSEMREYILGVLPKDMGKVMKRWRRNLHQLRQKASEMVFSQDDTPTADELHALKLWENGALYQMNRQMRGMDPNPPKDVVAKKDDWTTLPMPKQTVRFSLKMGMCAEEFATLSMGHIPEEMEDKWFYYFEESDSTMRFHRSWTGYCIFIAKIDSIDDGFCVTDVIANQDPEQFPETSIESMRALISMLVAQDIGRDATEYWDLI